MSKKDYKSIENIARELTEENASKILKQLHGLGIEFDSISIGSAILAFLRIGTWKEGLQQVAAEVIAKIPQTLKFHPAMQMPYKEVLKSLIVKLMSRATDEERAKIFFEILEQLYLMTFLDRLDIIELLEAFVADEGMSLNILFEFTDKFLNFFEPKNLSKNCQMRVKKAGEILASRAVNEDAYSMKTIYTSGVLNCLQVRSELPRLDDEYKELVRKIQNKEFIDYQNLRLAVEDPMRQAPFFYLNAIQYDSSPKEFANFISKAMGISESFVALAKAIPPFLGIAFRDQDFETMKKHSNKQIIRMSKFTDELSKFGLISIKLLETILTYIKDKPCQTETSIKCREILSSTLQALQEKDRNQSSLSQSGVVPLENACVLFLIHRKVQITYYN